jgi:hypothetical protein
MQKILYRRWIMTYEEWYNKNEEELSIECAESGADRELDFDFERFCEDKYEIFLSELGCWNCLYSWHFTDELPCVACYEGGKWGPKE